MKKQTTRREKYNRIYEAATPFREAKKNTIHALAGVGRKHRWLRYPLLLVMTAFIFVYNLILYLLMGLQVEEKLAKALAILLTISLVFTSVDVTALAFADDEQTESYEDTSELSVDDTSGGDSSSEEGGSEGSGEGSAESGQGEGSSEGGTSEGGATEGSQGEGSSEGGSTGDGTSEGGTSEGGTTEEGKEGEPAEGETEGGLTDGETGELLPEELPEEETEKAEDTDEAAEEAFDQSVIENGVEVSVSAPEGVFPAGAQLKVSTITGGDASEIEQLVAEKKDAETDENTIVVVEQSYSFDITIVDETGAEVEPDTSRGEVSVSFKNVGAAQAEQQEEKELSVFYVSDDYSEAEELSHSVDTDADAAVITAEHFSIYTVVITTKESDEEKNYILHYYQGSSIAESYFTIYSEKELLLYKELLDGYVNGKVEDTDHISTILVNADDANPMEGITGDGQATDMTVSNLNLSAKLMDDITVTSAWSPISKFCNWMTFNGGGHTITLTSLAVGVTFDENNMSALFVTAQNEGTIKNLTIQFGDKSYRFPTDEKEEEPLYATVTVRVDGQKAEIGEAITGAEALAVSADGGQTYITLERDDDLSVYRTELANLFPDANEEELKETAANSTTVYKVYYVYEDENDQISAAELKAYNEYTDVLNYVSVTYDLEGANTYREEDDGTLSEDVMAAVRVNVLSDGSYEAKEDYDAVVMAAEGYEIPTKEYHVVVKVGGVELDRGNDYTYTYDAKTKRGYIHINKEKITNKIYVEVEADVESDKPANKIVLKTRGGSIVDALWDETEDGAYEQTVYEGTKKTELPKTLTAYKGSDAIEFAGWYTDMSCTGTAVTEHTFVETKDGETTTVTYYAKWVLAKITSYNKTLGYEYQSDGDLDIRGIASDDSAKVTYGYGGFHPRYNLGELTSAQTAGSTGGSEPRWVYSANTDIFKQIGSSDLYVAAICTLDSNSLVDITYIFENRGDSTYTDKLYFGLCADVAIAGDDQANVEIETTDSGVKYMNMTATHGSYTGMQFRLYIDGTDFGIDSLFSRWYGEYKSGGYKNKVFHQGNDSNIGDSALAFSWLVNNIPAGGYVTRTTKMGLADVSTMSNIVANLHAIRGTFADGSSDFSVSSNQRSITINTDGSITVKKTTGDETIGAPTRQGYVFSHWSAASQNENSCAGKTYTESVELYANYVPKPDRSVTNNSSVQKVNGSDNLLVPSALGKIVIENTTTGATTKEIDQGATAKEAAGYASGFSGILKIAGEDDRYLLPDDIEVTVTADDGTVTKLTKDTGYTYTVYDNRKKASLEIKKLYINGDITITAIGYELPPVTATSVEVQVSKESVSYGERAVFTAKAITSKNHVATYQWYIAPYYEITLDNKTDWTYQNQDGVALQNGTYAFTDSKTEDSVKTTINWNNGKAVTISGANKATLRISGLDVNAFGDSIATDDSGLHLGGYHVYCVVTSTRNITGQEVVAVSDVAEVEVTQAQYAAPTGLEGSATTYNGSSDGEIVIASQNNRPTLLYKKSTETDTDGNWKTVSSAELEAGVITGLTAGKYQFKYKADANHTASDVTTVTVDAGRDIIVTYKSAGADDESLRSQTKHVQYGTTVTASSADVSDEGKSIQEPARKGYTFAGWSPSSIPNITKDTTVNATYTPSVYKITLDTVKDKADESKDTDGTSAIYEKYSDGFYTDQSCTSGNKISSVTGITIPKRSGYLFLGYFTDKENGTQMIGADGCLSGNLTATYYLEAATLYAHWEKVDEPEIDPSAETYTITYKDAGSTSAGADFSGQFTSYAQTTGASGTAVTLPTAVKTGYTLGGWYLNGKGTGRAITEISASQKQNVTVYAKWIANKYTITLVMNEGSFVDGYTPADQYAHGGSNVALPTADQITRENYTFLGWFDNADLLGDAITEVDASQVSAQTYYAGWEKLAAHEITLTEDGENEKVYAIQGEEGFGFTEDGKTYVYDGKAYSFRVTPASAYEIQSVKANGKVVSGTRVESSGKIYYVYRLTSVTEDTVVTVTANKLVSTDEGQQTNAVATIQLADGTTGYFDTLEAAIDYAANHGSGSVIVLQKDLPTEEDDDLEIDAIAGSAYTIDLNGKTVRGSLLVENGTELTLTDSVRGTEATGNELSIENRGTLYNGTDASNGIVISELLNIGTVTNYGTVTKMTQQESETEGEKSKFVNYGTIGTAELESGYFVDGTGAQDAPAGLTGYHTIMNGNEYYVDFSDAVDIANKSDTDVTIKILATVDNLGKTIALNNINGKAIKVDLSGYHISSGEIKTDGTVSFINSNGSATNVSEITSKLTNNGNLTIGNYVKVSGETLNETGGQMQTEPNATISGPVTNKGGFDNDGNITGVYTNDGGNTVNDGTMNNVIQKDGTFTNNNEIKTKLDLQGGSYTAPKGSEGTVPDGAVAKSNTTPVTYYGTLADATKDASDPEVTGAEGQVTPFVITILKDITDEDMGTDGTDSVVISPIALVEINLNNHRIGDENSKKTLEIKPGSGSGSGEETSKQVTIANEPENGEEANPEKGKINTPVSVEEGSSVDIGGGVSLDQVDNSGDLTLEKGSSVNELTQTGGSTENKGGTIDKLDQSGGKTTNEDGGKIGTVTQSGGETVNEGGTIDEMTQTGGTTTNTDGGTIGKLTQDGGNVENEEGSTIEDATLNKGSYTGETPKKVGGESTEGKGESEGKAAQITTQNGETIYFVNLDDALEYASNMDSSEAPVTVKLLKDIKDEQINVSPTKSPATNVKLDLNGHDIGEKASITLDKGTNLTIGDDSAGEKGTIAAPITNQGGSSLKIEDVDVSGNVTNTDGSSLTIGGGTDISGKVTNGEGSNLTIDPNGEISGGLENSGDTTNNGKITGGVEQKGGTFTNGQGASTDTITQTGGETINQDTSGSGESGIGSVDLKKGSYEGAAPKNGSPEGVATRSDGKTYADIESAIEDANNAAGDVTIKLNEDVTLNNSETLVIDNKNGKNINIDLNGNNITGGTVQVGGDDSAGGSSAGDGNVTFTDSSSEGAGGSGGKGTISSRVDVKKDGNLTIGGGVTADGDVTVSGDLDIGTGSAVDGNIKVDGGDVTLNPGSSVTGNVDVKDGGDVKIGEGANVKGDVTVDKDSSLENEKGTIDGNVTSKGDVTNDGDIKGKVTQEGGSITNGENGTIGSVEQSGGSFKNENENKDSIGSAKVTGGSYEGTEAKDMNRDGAKVAVITKDPDGSEKTTYYPSIDDAIKAAEKNGGNATIKLLDDVDDDDATNITINKPGITLDLNGHDVKVPVTITEGATNTTITDTSSSTEKGKLSDTLTNGGGLTIDDGVTATDVKNKETGSLDNKGTIDKLTNEGDATNNGTITTVDQKSGSLENNKTIDTVKLTGGSYEGEKPTSQEGSENTDAVAKIGDKYYAFLEEAIADANKSSEDVTIEVLKDTTLSGAGQGGSVAIGNENGKNIKIDLNGHNVDGSDSALEVKGPGQTTITDSDGSGSGSLHTNVTVKEGVSLTVDKDTEIDGSVNNRGTTTNNGTITDEVTNSGTLNNGGDGIIGGAVDNTGSLTNEGNIDNDVINHENGQVDNSGNLNGQLENKDNASADNTGAINQVKQTGGSVTNGEGGSINDYLENGGNLKNEEGGSIGSLTQNGGTSDSEGTIKDATVSDLSNYTGKLPENGLPGAGASVTYKDGSGETKTAYYDTLQDALDAAKNQTPATVTPVTDKTTITGDVTIPSGVTVEVPDGKELEVAEGGTLKNDGIIKNDGSVTNNGTLENGSTGKIDNTGDVSTGATGTTTNKGSINNQGGSLSGTDGTGETTGGKIVNEGSISGGSVTGPLDNTSSGSITGSDKISGEINNEGSIRVPTSADTSDATIENEGGGSFAKVDPKPSNPGSGDSGSGSHSGGHSSGDQSEDTSTDVQPAASPIIASPVPGASGEGASETATATGASASAKPGSTAKPTVNPDNTEKTKEEQAAKEEAVLEQIKQSLSDGKISIEGIEGLGGTAGGSNNGSSSGNGSGSSNGSTSIVMTPEEQSQFIDSILTEEEKEQVLDGASVRIWAETVVSADHEMKETYEKALKEAFPNVKDASLLNVSLFKQIGDGEKILVNGKTSVQVSFEVPEEYRELTAQEGGFKILRIVEDEDGQITFEEVEYTLTDNTITMVMETEAEYVIVSEDYYAQNDASGEAGELTLTQTEDEDQGSTPWYLIPIGLFVLAAIFFVIKRKKDHDDDMSVE